MGSRARATQYRKSRKPDRFRVSGPRSGYCKHVPVGGNETHPHTKTFRVWLAKLLNMEDGEASGNNSCESVDQNDGVSTSCVRSDQPEENKQDEPAKEEQSDTKRREKDSEQNDFYPFTM